LSLHFGDMVRIAAPQERVWEFLLDPDSLGPCGPGVESVEVIDETHYRAIVKVGIAQFRARFKVNLELTHTEPISQAHVRGTAHAPGTAVDATARMNLESAGENETIMTWEADVNVSGQLAAVGTRLINWTANKLIAQTFDCVRSSLAEPAATSNS
jgi:carbon monoxide dehydrogenase subunit G